MRYIGFDMGDGESAVAAFEPGSGIEPLILPVCGARSLLSAVGLLRGEVVIGERAYTDALADALSVRFKSRFTTDMSSSEDIIRFVRGVMRDLMETGQLSPDDRFVVGCPAGWNAACRAHYRDLLIRAGMHLPQVISESRAAFLYAKYARTVAVDIDIMGESALVVDIGSSTLDYAYIVDGRETGIGTFGETALGGGILDAAILRSAVAKNRSRREIEATFKESRSWYSYCEIEARRLKEEYFTRLSVETAPCVKKQLRICYDGVQKLMLEITNDEIERMINEPLPELDGRTFLSALRESLENAARITADRPPCMLLLTGGASRMPFFRELCSEIFESAVIISCPEPEFSIAKGLSYAGWIDENLKAFRQAIHAEVTDARVSSIAGDALPSLLPSVAGLLTDLILNEAALPAAEEWKRGRIRTFEDMNRLIGERAQHVLTSPLAHETLQPAVQIWLDEVTQKLQALIDPICDRFDVPRKQMELNLTGNCGNIVLDADNWLELPVARSILSVIVSVTAGILCGGSGVALVASGPLGFLAGVAAGVIAAFLGWNTISDALSKADLPLFMRLIPIEARLKSDKTRREISRQILDSLSGENSDFHRQIVGEFSKAFRAYLYSIAQAAEIPIE